MVKRYDASGNDCEIYEAKYGDLVEYEDYAKLESEHKSAMLTLYEIVEILGTSDTLSISEEVASLQLQVVNLAAENAELKESVEHAAGCISAAEAEGLIDALSETTDERLADLVHRRLCHAYLEVKTPATDAAIANIQAHGVQKLSEFAGKEYQRVVGDKTLQRKWKGIVLLCTDFASQLRKGASND